MARPDRAWRTVAAEECRELWLGGRGPILVLAACCLFSVITFLSSTNQALNFLEQRESVNLVLQVAVAVGCLLTMIAAADAISGERERETLETLLLTPVTRRSIVLGKVIAAMTLWAATLLVSVPYLWVLGRGVGVLGRVLAVGAIVGTLLALGTACLALVISGRARSNRISLGASAFLLLALTAPTQLPAGARQGALGDLVTRIGPIAAGERYIGGLVVNAAPWTAGLSDLVSPVATVLIAGAVLLLAHERLLALDPGIEGRR